MHSVSLPDGEQVAALGQGSWGLGENRNRRAEELAAIREGVALGMTLIDTAEMYGEGGTESFLAEALAGLRDQVFLVSKAYPQNAGRARLAQACEQSLRRLNTDRLDLYLLHWRGNVPLGETAEAMQALQRKGKIRHWGVSNLDTEDMRELESLGGQTCATNQILYNLTRRGPEYDLLPWMQARRMPLMAYSPIEQGRLPAKNALKAIAQRHEATPLQIALAWVLHRTDAIVIPKAARLDHVRQNHAAAEIVLADDDLKALDEAFPPPSHKVPLAML
ncbi:aldo/keto reductase [Telmatospirillum siberiense]|uniref:Aldo/keto reductase n=1 Tax=Telmatospirillum siberiense TaxID=382514 RepID=A0A2N3PXB4_9PROT|nr:aldo/keto reductase [Telmatospirillum siberiense]PKU25046.1 aldo/keto reductase [Telmatospirillum siberiense]